MVTRNRSNLDKPEEKIAKRLLERNQLSSPKDVEQLVRKYANIEIAEIPNNIDAILLEEQKNKPLILLSNKLSPNRKRFTLAHELGHILIPWHVGTIFCHTEKNYKFNDEKYYTIEKEANNFASELLLNSDWVYDILEKYPINAAFLELRKALVSDYVIILKLQKFLPHGILVALEDGSKQVVAYANTIRKIKDEEIAKIDLTAVLTEYTTYQISSTMGNQIRIYQDPAIYSKDDNYNFDRIIKTEELSKVLLGRILEKHNLKSKISVINGVIGAANTQFKNANDYQLYIIIKNRFAEKAQFPKLISDPEFDQFLISKTKELRTNL